MNALFTAVRAMVWATAFLSLWGWLALAVRRYDAALGGALADWSPFAGWPLVVAGAALALTCVALFVVRGRGTPAPFDAPQKFVAVGPYRHVRNPMYLGGIATLAGCALVFRSPAMLVFVLVPCGCVQVFLLAFEEPDLNARFGESYRAYQRAVPRWRPRLIPWRGPDGGGV